MPSSDDRQMPAWLARLWPQGEDHRRLLRVLRALGRDDAQALAVFLRDHAQFYEAPATPSRTRSRAA